MAEFCRDCFYRLNPNTQYTVVLSKPWDRDLCEGCRKMKRVVVDLRPSMLLELIGFEEEKPITNPRQE